MIIDQLPKFLSLWLPPKDMHHRETLPIALQSSPSVAWHC